MSNKGTTAKRISTVDQIIIFKNNIFKSRLSPGTGYGHTKITWRDGKIAQIEHSETEK